MALIGNYSLLNRNPKIHFGGGTIANFPGVFGGAWKNRQYGAYRKVSGTPMGYLHPGSYVLPMTAGGIVSESSALISPTNGALAMGINVNSNISSVISVTSANISAIVDLLSSLSASGAFTNADVLLLNNVSSNISATLAITNADIQTLSVVLLGSNLSGVITLSSGTLGAIIGLESSFSGSISGTTIVNILVNVSADIGGATPLSPEGLAQAVWSTVSNDYIADTGTFGYQLANSGTGLSAVDIANEVWNTNISTFTIPDTAGDQLNSSSGATGPTTTDIANAVWNKPLSENTSSGTFGLLLQKLLTVAKFLGLK